MAGPVGFQNGEPVKAIDRCGFRLPDHDDEAKISNERSRFKGVSNGMSRLRRYIRLTPREPASGGWIDGDDIFASIAVPPTTKTSTLVDWLKQNKGDAMGPNSMADQLARDERGLSCAVTLVATLSWCASDES
jgi:hypothetical protein